MTDTTAAPTRTDYAEAVELFRIENAIAALQGDLDTGLNACAECVDRHCGDGRVALRHLAPDGRMTDYSFEDLRDMSARMANLLTSQGVGPGDVVAGMLPRTPELMALVLGCWRAGAVYQPLFTAFGPKAIAQRLETSGARMVVTNAANRAKLDDVPGCPPVACVVGPEATLRAGDLDLTAALAQQTTAFAPVPRTGDDLFLMMSTSGTTGAPKGVPVPLRALLSFAAYMRDAVDLRAGDVFWNIADPGWAYGLYYGITGPLLLGQATIFVEAGFTAAGAYDVIRRMGVTNLAGSPTAFRMMIAEGAPEDMLGRLRVVSSAGEPLNPDVIRWFADHLGAPIHDHYGQTELGMVVNNHHGLSHQVRPGSAGYAMPGYRVVVLDAQGRELGPREPGILAVDLARSPLLWFRGYHRKDTPAIANGYYSTGDSVEFGDDGSISFIGRADDVITSSGYRIGPFDVESALLEHPAVIEAAVIGVPDADRTEIVKAFVVLDKSATASAELAETLAQHVKRRLSAHAYPRAVAFVDELPKTPSGKIQRFVLRQAEIAAKDSAAPDNAPAPLPGPPARMEVRDHVFLITGGGSGLGAAVARMVVDGGGRAVLLDVNAQTGAAEAAALGPNAIFVKTDVTSDAEGQAAVAAALAAFGRIDVMVNCAGIAPGEKIVGKDGPHRLDSFARAIGINLIGTFNMLRLAANAMAGNTPGADGCRGVVVNTASIAAMDGQIGQAAYAASKGGVVSLTLPAARELARYGIRVVTIAPGIFGTPMMAGLPDAVQESLGASVPFPSRLGQPAEYAALVRHIVENQMLNGEVIRLDGALRMAPR